MHKNQLLAISDKLCRRFVESRHHNVRLYSSPSRRRTILRPPFPLHSPPLVCKLASFFKNVAGTQQSRPPTNPSSSFLNGLQPVASKDIKLSRRVSRTELDFEQALRAGGTVMLKESVDVNSLGAVDTPSPSKNQLPGHEFASPTPPQKDMWTPRVPQAPATPVVVPPTPSPAPPAYTRPGSSSSSNEVFYDAEDTDNMPSKRRSIYRSPGTTSSSPDLATLARRAKERGTVVPAKLVQSQKEKRPTEPPPPPLPTTSSNSNSHARASPAASSTLRASARPRSSTSGAGAGRSGCPPPPKLSITPASYRSSARSAKDPTSPNGSDWVMPSPRSRTSSKAGSDKVRGF